MLNLIKNNIYDKSIKHLKGNHKKDGEASYANYGKEVKTCSLSGDHKVPSGISNINNDIYIYIIYNNVH